jgi:DNA-binding NarL/FixJ family response regulator
VRTVLVVDDRTVSTLESEIRPDVIVVDGSLDTLRRLKTDEHPLAGVPVVMLIDASDVEMWLHATIEGAVSAVSKPVESRVLARALDQVVGPDALPEPVQRHRARVEALEAIARFEAHGFDHLPDRSGGRVHLTRLEHQPVRTPEPSPAGDVRRRFDTCTDHQRALIDVIAREGSVSGAAARLGTNRSSLYASLRRIVHRLHLRDTAELLRLVARGELP